MVTVFMLKQDKVMLGAGTYPIGLSRLIHCETDGTIKLIFRDGNTVGGYAMVLGDDRGFGEEVVGVTVESGTFSLC